jgi:hypothetical protein
VLLTFVSGSFAVIRRCLFVLFGVLVFLSCHPKQSDEDWSHNPRRVSGPSKLPSHTGITKDWNGPDNPFSPRPIIEYSIADSADVLLVVMNVTKSVSDTIIKTRQGSGFYEAYLFLKTERPSGIYFYEFHVGDTTKFGKTVFLK